MRWTDQASVRPHRCAVLPYVGNGKGHAFLDTGQDLDLEHVYISDVACEEIARMLGWVPVHHVRQAQVKQAKAEARVEELERERDNLQARFDAIDVIESAEFRARKKPGRKAKKEEQAA